MAPEGFDCQVALYPLEEGLNLPPVPVQIRYLQSADISLVRNERKIFVILRIVVLDHTDRLGI